MQEATISVLLIAAICLTAGVLMAWAASNSRHYLAFRIHRGISRLGYFLASYLLTLVPFAAGYLEPSHANEPIIVIGIIGSLIVSYYATRAQIRWHENRRSSTEN